jgi:hypothetical protein
MQLLLTAVFATVLLLAPQGEICIYIKPTGASLMRFGIVHMEWPDVRSSSTHTF